MCVTRTGGQDVALPFLGETCAKKKAACVALMLMLNQDKVTEGNHGVEAFKAVLRSLNKSGRSQVAKANCCKNGQIIKNMDPVTAMRNTEKRCPQADARGFAGCLDVCAHVCCLHLLVKAAHDWKSNSGWQSLVLKAVVDEADTQQTLSLSCVSQFANVLANGFDHPCSLFPS